MHEMPLSFVVVVVDVDVAACCCYCCSYFFLCIESLLCQALHGPYLRIFMSEVTASDEIESEVWMAIQPCF